MKRAVMMIAVAVVFGLVGLATGQAAPAVPPVSDGLVCWYDAAAGVTTGSNGVVRAWNDLSGNHHYATLAAGAPKLAGNQINSRPAVQFRTANGACGFNLDGPFFVEEQYVVVRSPNAKWNSDGCFLGRRWARSSSYRLGRGSAGFWGDQYPEAVSRNGKRVGRPFDLAPITEYMVLKIDVNDGDMSRNTYQIGMADMASCDFDVAEILGYTSRLSANEEAAVGTYLAAKYGISTSYSAPTNVVSASAIVHPPVSAKPSGPVVVNRKPALSVTNGLVCWYDAAVGVTTGNNGAIQSWNDLSGQAHHGTPGGGRAPVLALNQIDSKPTVQFRGNWLALAGTFFTKEQYVVLRSPSDKWSGPGSFLGRLKGRGSSYNTWGNDTGFWHDQSPAGVTRNGAVLPGPTFDCSPITNYMVLKIDVNDNAASEASYGIGNNDGMAGCSFDVAEIIGYQRMLSPLEEDSVGAYLAAKYGISTEYAPLPPAGPVPVAETAATKYKGWQHSGSMYLLTTPEGANLPATASEEDFPVLVRLSKDWFNFAEAKANGEDLRFATGSGTPLAYQIDNWDAAGGVAGIWVRVPTINGNARQEIKMYWGKADAESESSGLAVFNRSNGYLSVWHMNEPVKDDAGTLESKDLGTTSAAGMIGSARHFSGGKGIDCGGKITTYPFASSPHSSEAWFKADKFNTTILDWGKYDDVRLRLLSTPGRIGVDGRGGSLQGTSVLPKSEWIQVVHTYNGQRGLIYVNGRLDTPTGLAQTMSVLTPVRLEIGGGFVGDLDEVRVSRWARSADWVKLQYENQKPMQTLVGPLVQPGKAFSVSASSLKLDEGKSMTITAKAGGAQKVCWILKKDGAESVAAVDKYSYTLDAGRVVADTSYVLQFKAVYANEVKTKDIAVTVKEAIPEPVFTLKAPSKWNGRETIEVVPEISNLKALKDKGAGALHYAWEVSGGVVMQEVAPDRLILRLSQYTGPITVKAAINNGGAESVVTKSIMVTEPKSDPWIERIPGKDEKPEDGQFYARDDKNEGTLFYNGTLSNTVELVFLKVYAGDKLIKTETQKPTAENAYAFTAKLKAGLIKYRVEFGTKTGGAETVLHTVTNLVCGDAYFIDGQSNALALDTGEQSPHETNEWIRSYGGPTGRGDSTDWVRDRFGKGRRPNLWCCPSWRTEAALGWWGMDLAKRLLASQKTPIFILQAAVGGTRIDEHKRCETNHADLSTMYGKMLWRAQNARLTHGIRGVLWHQGEADQGLDGPDGGYGWETYQQYFVHLSLAWKQDFPNLRHYYVFQIWPNGCSQGGGHGDMLREVQRTLPRLYSNLDVMSTLGIRPPGPCHYPLIGWTEFARRMQPLIERDFYGKAPATSITAPNLRRALYTSSAKDAILLEFDQPVVWTDALTSQFYLDGVVGEIASGAVSGNLVNLKLKESSAAKKITYLKELDWSQDKLLVGANGIAALTFCDVPLEPAR